MIKFNKSLNNYQFCLSFDLSKHSTGWSLIDFISNRIILSGIIKDNSDEERSLKYFYDDVLSVLDTCKTVVGSDNISKIFVIKEKLPNQSGRFSTIGTLQALAQTHAIFDLALLHSNLDYYDMEGVHSTSAKAYFRHITGVEKPEKQDIYDKISNLFSEDTDKILNFDVSDSIAVTLTLINSKWNKDIDDEIKELKKSLKKFKSDKKISEINNQINQLKELKYEGKKEI